jgi:protein gp37
MGYEPGVHLCDQWLNKPVHWKAPRTVLVCLLGDLFHEDVSDHYLLEMFMMMAICQDHIFMVLTKRPERMRDFVAGLCPIFSADMWPLPNIWFGVSAENQARADERIPILTQMKAEGLAARIWVSAEPLLGAIDLSSFLPCGDPVCKEELTFLDFVVLGGESGPHARPCDLGWIRDVRDQCKAAGVSVYVKQLGSWWVKSLAKDLEASGLRAAVADKLAAQVDFKGEDMAFWPADLRVRELPEEVSDARS